MFAEDGSETMRYLMRYEVTIDREKAISNLKQILPLSPQGVLMSPV
ncbi:hypothetical protein ACP0HM_19435 [Escherichia coli]